MATINGIQPRVEKHNPPTEDKVLSTLSRHNLGKVASSNGLSAGIVHEMLWWNIVELYFIVFDLMHYFHNEMVTAVAVGREEAAPFKVGLHQGCTMFQHCLFWILN